MDDVADRRQLRLVGHLEHGLVGADVAERDAQRERVRGVGDERLDQLPPARITAHRPSLFACAEGGCAPGYWVWSSPMRRLLAVLLLPAALPGDRLRLGAGRLGTVHPGVQTFTDGGQCTANFVFQDGSNVYLGQAAHCSGTGGQTDTDGCNTRLAAARHAGRDRRAPASPGTLVYNSWLTMQANGRDGRGHLRLQRPRAGQARSGRRRARSTRRCPASAARPASATLGGTRLDRLLLRQLLAARRRHPAQPEAGHRRPDDGGGWSHTVYTADARHPRRLGQRLPERRRAGARRAQHRCSSRRSPASNGVGDLGQRARLHARPQRLWRGAASCRAPSRSTRTSSPRFSPAPARARAAPRRRRAGCAGPCRTCRRTRRAACRRRSRAAAPRGSSRCRRQPGRAPRG